MTAPCLEGPRSQRSFQHCSAKSCGSFQQVCHCQPGQPPAPVSEMFFIEKAPLGHCKCPTMQQRAEGLSRAQTPGGSQLCSPERDPEGFADCPLLRSPMALSSSPLALRGSVQLRTIQVCPVLAPRAALGQGHGQATSPFPAASPVTTRGCSGAGWGWKLMIYGPFIAGRRGGSPPRPELPPCTSPCVRSLPVAAAAIHRQLVTKPQGPVLSQRGRPDVPPWCQQGHLPSGGARRRSFLVCPSFWWLQAFLNCGCTSPDSSWRTVSPRARLGHDCPSRTGQALGPLALSQVL